MVSHSQISNVSAIAESILDDDIPRDLEKVWDAWKDLGESLKYTGPVAWRVKGGFSFQTDFPAIASPFDKSLSNIQQWPLRNNEPTLPSIVFWIPRPLNGDFENTQHRHTLIEKVRRDHGLPEHHLVSFGSASLISALLLAGAKEGKLFNYCYSNLWYDGFPTDTITETGFRVYIRYFSRRNGYKCLRWPVYSGDDHYGFLPIGIELGR